jgi:D-3-phosphoglycerate dehydrogenase / 2-oxoglutarate reductase
VNILFLDEVHEVLAERLTAEGFNCVNGYDQSREQCESLMDTTDGIVVRSRFPMDEDFLKRAPNLKFVARSGAGMENIDLDYCTRRNIKCYSSPEGNRNAVAEHALGMLLSLMNKMPSAHEQVKHGIWDRDNNRGIELDGKTVAIIGFGNNGSAFAKKLKGFDVKILAYDKYKTGFGTSQVIESRMEVIFEEADVISFHIPQNEETLFMCNQSYLDAFKKPIFLLNLSRGKILNTESLVNNLKNGKVLAAGLDVLEYEKASFEDFFAGKLPEAFDYLLKAKNVILTPHVGGWTNESYFKLSNVLADKIMQDFG